ERVLKRTRLHLRQRADEVRLENVLLDGRRVVQRRGQRRDAVVGRGEAPHDRKARRAAADTGLEAAAGRVTLLAPVVAEVRRADHRAPRLELAAAALPDDVVR